MRILVVWLINTVALLAVSYLMTSVHVTSFGAALIAAGLLGLVNAVIRPLIVVLTLPVTILTLGLFIFIINGILFLAVANLLEGFQVAGFWPAVLAAIVYSLVSWVLSALILR